MPDGYDYEIYLIRIMGWEVKGEFKITNDGAVLFVGKNKIFFVVFGGILLLTYMRLKN